MNKSNIIQKSLALTRDFLKFIYSDLLFCIPQQEEFLQFLQDEHPIHFIPFFFCLTMYITAATKTTTIIANAI